MNILIDKQLEKIGKTRYWLSQKTDVAYPNIKKLCDGNSVQLSTKTLDKICTALDCSIGDILSNEIDLDTILNLNNDKDKVTSEQIQLPINEIDSDNKDSYIKNFNKIYEINYNDLEKIIMPKVKDEVDSYIKKHLIELTKLEHIYNDLVKLEKSDNESSNKNKDQE